MRAADKVLGILLGFCVTVRAADIMTPAECIIRGKAYGSNKLSGSKSFSHDQAVEAFLPIHYTPFEYALCLDLKNNNKLVSFAIKYADAAVSSTFALPRVGPNGGTCATTKAANRDFPAAYTVFQDGQGLDAIQILSRGEGASIFTLGKPNKTRDESSVFQFDDKMDLIGFYGIQGDTAIGTLGFLFRNNTCV